MTVSTLHWRAFAHRRTLCGTHKMLAFWAYQAQRPSGALKRDMMHALRIVLTGFSFAASMP